MKEKVEAALVEIRKALIEEGGGIELIDIVDGVVKVRLKGACSCCPMSQMTMTNFVEAFLKKRVPEIKKVEAVQ